MTVPNLHTRNYVKFIGLAFEKYFVDLLGASWTILLAILPTSLFLLTFFTNLSNFVDLSGLVSPVMCAEIPLSAKKCSAALIHHHTYYAKSSPKFLVQSRCYAGHIPHNMLFSVWHQLGKTLDGHEDTNGN